MYIIILRHDYFKIKKIRRKENVIFSVRKRDISKRNEY